MTQRVAPDPRRRLIALWDLLGDYGAHVTRHDVTTLTDDVAKALYTEQARRLRALIEGIAAGWTPDWRTRPASTDHQHDDSQHADVVPIHKPTTATPTPTNPPVIVPRHRPSWRTGA